VVSGYFTTDWVADDAPRLPLPVALDLGGLYDRILAALMPAAVREGEDMAARVTRLEAVRAKTREVDRIRLRLDRERQFNKRVAINAELREALKELERLGGVRPSGSDT
jgi:hypothetical protein